MAAVPSLHRVRIAVVDAEPTPFDDLADLVVREPNGTAFPGWSRATDRGG